MPGSSGPKIHSQARLHCCAACGQGEAKLTVKSGSKLEMLIKTYAHLSYDATVESFPAGCCKSCQQDMYRCKRAKESEKPVEPHKKWTKFKLENIHVPQTSANCSECTCPMCNCAHYNPIGMTGIKKLSTTLLSIPMVARCSVRHSSQLKDRAAARGCVLSVGR